MVENRAQKLGHYGEDLARVFLNACGFECLVSRYRKPGGEIDLVMRRDQLLVFVEVKTRSTVGFGLPEEALTSSQSIRLRRLARHYLYEHSGGGAKEYRFDLVAVEFGREGNSCQLRHYPGVI